MDPRLRIVTQIPLPTVWGPDGVDRRLSKQAGLTAASIRELLREPSTSIVVAEVGLPLRWIEGSDRFEFWKREVAARLADPHSAIDLESFPGEYCYLAHEWAGVDGRAVVLVKLH
jgi:hypothetical protein